MAEVETPLQIPMDFPLEAETQDEDPQESLSLTTTGPVLKQETTLVTTNAEGKRVKKIIRKKKRPARPQVDAATFKSEPPPQTGTIFNIWYNKWSGGDREDSYLSKQPAKGRCSLAKDTGYTRADTTQGAYFCLFFARGICPKGQDCEYLHRLPSTFDIYSGNVDCFGRDKHSDYRDDMGGVGSFSRQNRTLYVGRIHPTDDIEEIVARHFAEWGNIERTRVLPTRGVAFVTYTTECLAQFAKEAMAHQSLDNSEVLNVRWATVDPNPASQKREARMIEEQAADAIRKALPEAFVKEIEGDRDAKRRRLEDGAFGLDGYQASDDVWFKSEKARLASARIDDGPSIRALDAPSQPLLIGQSQSQSEDRSNSLANGLLGASTLAALNGYKPSSTTTASKAPPSKALLVGYDSDDDSD